MGCLNTWPDQHADFLKDHAAEGHSATHLAQLLNFKFRTGYTRNAVIGKLNRMGLAGMTSRNPRTYATHKAKPLKPMHAVPASRTLPDLPMNPLPPKEETDIARIKFADLEAYHCRFPVGDPKEADFGFCGENAHPGMPYCVNHARRCLQLPGVPSSGRVINGKHSFARAAAAITGASTKAIAEAASFPVDARQFEIVE